MAQVDARRFPTVAEYLERHGGRLDRYPQCQSKGGLLRDVVDFKPLHSIEGALPAEVVELLRNPPPVNVWTPEMLVEVAFQAVADEYFPTQEAAEAWVFERDLSRFQSRLYRLLMAVISPEAMLRAAGKRWAAFHRGSTLEVEFPEPHTVIGLLRFPPWLYLPHAKINMAGSFRAALVAAGAKSASCRLIEADESLHRFEGTWE